MKKWSYIVGGFILGITVALAGSTAYAEIQSLIGKKVSGEMTVVVNGTELQNRGAVIEGVTNAPVRSLTEALGVGLSVEGKTIYITSQDSSEKEALLLKKAELEKSISSTQIEIQKTKDKMEQAKIPGSDKYEAEETWKAAITSLETSLSKKQADLDIVNEALKEFE